MSTATELFEHLKLNLLENNLIDQKSMKSNIVILNNQPGYEESIDLTPYFDSYKVLKFDTPTYVSDDSYNLKKVKHIARLCAILKEANEEATSGNLGLAVIDQELPNVRIQLFSKLFEHEGSDLRLLHYIYLTSFNEWWSNILKTSKLDITKYNYPLLDKEGLLDNLIRNLGQQTLAAYKILTK